MWLTQQKVYHYHDFNEDLVISRQQEFHLPAQFQWQSKRLRTSISTKVVRVLAGFISYWYCRCWYRARIIGANKLNQLSGQSSYILYGNHTQPTADVLLPIYLGGSNHFNAIVGLANLGIPILGRLMLFAGAMPVPTGIQQTKRFTTAINNLLETRQFLVIYPEAHVWPYYTQIRPLALSAFHFPITNHVPAYVLTTTYQKRRFSNRPQITTFIDGPFWPDSKLFNKAQQVQLRQLVYQQMQKRAQHSNYQYVQYRQGDE